ncbi:MAG TPA: UDP-N-acetylmuramoyl-tripeptide--D-alanyl-D-alanine ligase [Verrucomicrobiae bacterium]|nr:UDP-N-acetylmuramoyl-tripeptide--D-alanyl-D-alanine ligase [Verrucomicrobiae bacterium]
MDSRDLRFITNACGGKLLAGSADLPVERVCTDSRQARPGDLFIALAGERFDGHDFVNEVLAKGVAAVMTQPSRAPADSRGRGVIVVPDTRKALGALAARYRLEFEIPIIAVGGSNGKTTTKELIAHVLRQKLETVWSEASFNNDIGVPMTLLKLDRRHQAAVMEAGTNHPGELAPLVRMIKPQYGVITSIGREHLEFFKTIEGVSEEEGWLAELLPPEGKLLVNGDNAWSGSIAKRTRAGVVRIGLEEGNDWSAKGIRFEKGGAAFQIETPRREFQGEYRIQLIGRHQISNALFAIALGAELGLDREQIQRGLASCRGAKMRLQLWEVNGIQVLDDAYNANTDSMAAALETLRELPCDGRKVAVLGDMAELGETSRAAHEEVGRRAAELGVEQLFAVGRMAADMGRGARLGGLNRVFEFADVEAAAAAVKSFVKSGDALLLKASRATRIERVGELLRGEPMAFVS